MLHVKQSKAHINENSINHMIDHFNWMHMLGRARERANRATVYKKKNKVESIQCEELSLLEN